MVTMWDCVHEGDLHLNLICNVFVGAMNGDGILTFSEGGS